MDQAQNATADVSTAAGPHAAAPVRIGVDGYNLAMPRGTGVATYGRVLTEALAGMGHPVDMLYGQPISPRTTGLLREVAFFDSLDQERPRPRPRLLSQQWVRETVGDYQPSAAVPVPITGQVLAEGFRSRMPQFDRILNVMDLWGRAARHFALSGRFLRVRIPAPPAVMHWTYPVPVLLEGARNVYTLHDLVPLRMPFTTLDNKGGYLRLLQGCLRWGDGICTVSESSRQDIVALLDAPPDRVTNTYQSAEPGPMPVDDTGLAGWLAGVFGLQRDGYMLFFGALEPKKNVGRLLEAYLASGLATPLVIVGGRAWKAEGELRLLNRDGAGLAPAGAVRQFDYMPRPWLTALIRGARVVVFPSLYEGFGLPVLEAMQLGTPVITSTGGSLPEIAGEAALLVDPYSTGAIAGAMQALDGDAALRGRLSAAGLRQAESFAMPHYQDRLRAMYAGVLTRSPSGVKP